MTTQELKKLIETPNGAANVVRDLMNKPLILKWSDSKFLSSQYANRISALTGYNTVYIHSLSEMNDSDDFFDEEIKQLYIYEVENLKENITPDMERLIVIAKNVPADMLVDYVEMPKILNWQIEDFVKSRMEGLTDQEILWLCQVTKYDIYRLDQECKKLELFTPSIREALFRQMNTENAYSDLSPNNIFDFTNAIMKKDMKKIGDLVPELDSADLEPLGVVTTLIKQFKRIGQLQIMRKPAPGMSDKQFYYLLHNECGIYTNEKIIDNIEFLTGIDSDIKSGNLDINREQLLAYIVANVL